MKRRDFVRFGAGVAGGSTLVPLLGLGTRGWASPGPFAGAGRNDGPVRLGSNENPLGIPDSARAAVIRAFGTAHHYPGASMGALREALAARHGVDTSAIVLGSGSTEVLQMAVQSRIRPGLRVILPEPTFEDVDRYVLPHADQAEVVRIPILAREGSHDLEGMERAADRSPGGALVYVCNPNNPTGTITPVAPLKEWIDRTPRHFFLVDEAYAEYAEDPRYEPLDRWARERPNVVVTRTFSKVYGLAGLRVGYAVAHPEPASRMRLFATPTNPGQPGCVAALAALGDRAYVTRSLEANRRSRDIVLEALNEMELSSMKSHTNFVLHRIRGDLNLYRRRMAEAGFLVGRPFPPFLDHNRVSLGLPEDMVRWADTLRDFRARGWV